MFNKNETALEGTEYYDLVHDRSNIIVMGDSLGDAAMAAGSSATSNILKIGFLYENVTRLQLNYSNLFLFYSRFLFAGGKKSANLHGHL